MGMIVLCENGEMEWGCHGIVVGGGVFIFL